MQYAIDNKYYYNPASQTYKTLVDASESTISAAMMLIDGSAGLGNLYGKAASVGSTFKSIGKNAKKAYKDLWKMVLRISYNFNLSETINTPSIKK